MFQLIQKEMCEDAVVLSLSLPKINTFHFTSEIFNLL